MRNSISEVAIIIVIIIIIMGEYFYRIKVSVLYKYIQVKKGGNIFQKTVMNKMQC